ncbi:MAG: phenylalanine--tRNA ligase subunit beta [Ferruginibacter sp.]|nr:phenylalanine--tRNA ligase subunit beta [Cytophagales bacterium]
MKISLNWLNQYISLAEPAAEIAGLLTGSGLEVERIDEVESIPGGLRGLVIGEVLTCVKHPAADKLSLTTVDTGNGVVSPIVCGAPNVRVGQKVVVAAVGTTLHPTGADGLPGEPFTIKKAKIRGEASEGMICAEDEIGLGTSHEGILVLDTDLPNGTPAAVYFGRQTDYSLEIGLTPNRADAASHLGVARDLKALLKRPVQLPSVADFRVDSPAFSPAVLVENPAACPRYCGLTLGGLTVRESPDWLQNRLRSIGLTPINNVVDVTNFVLHELGQPLHAFDADAITGGRVVVKTLPAGTPFVTLDGQERKLAAFDLMICNAEEPMGIAGVFGGAKSGVKPGTTRIFLEGAHFSPESIRKTAQFHGLKTDASFRFERGTDPNLPVYALKRAASLLREVAGGQVTSEIVDHYPHPILPAEVRVTYRNIDRLAGTVIDRNTIKEILQNLDIGLLEENAEGLRLSVPPYRVDVTREADIVEEILRIYGFDRVAIAPHLNASYLAEFPVVDKNRLQYNVTQALAAHGFHEIITNSLTKPAYAEAIRPVGGIPPGEGTTRGEDVVMLNKLSEDLGVMRQTLLFSGLEVLAHNLNRRQKDLKVFEFGKVYYRAEGKYAEKSRLALLVTGGKGAESWQTPPRPADFHDVAGPVTNVLAQLNVRGWTSREADQRLWQYGLTYELNRKAVVTFGRVLPSLARLADVKQAVFYADFDWDYLTRSYHGDLAATEIAKFPEVRRDLSLVIDQRVTFEEIRTLALKQERSLLRAVNVFDVYEGENIGPDKKSYSVSFILQDDRQTLTDQVIDRTMQKLMTSFEKELNAVIRK